MEGDLRVRPSDSGLYSVSWIMKSRDRVVGPLAHVQPNQQILMFRVWAPNCVDRSVWRYFRKLGCQRSILMIRTWISRTVSPKRIQEIYGIELDYWVTRGVHPPSHWSLTRTEHHWGSPSITSTTKVVELVFSWSKKIYGIVVHNAIVQTGRIVFYGKGAEGVRAPGGGRSSQLKITLD